MLRTRVMPPAMLCRYIRCSIGVAFVAFMPRVSSTQQSETVPLPFRYAATPPSRIHA